MPENSYSDLYKKVHLAALMIYSGAGFDKPAMLKRKLEQYKDQYAADIEDLRSLNRKHTYKLGVPEKLRSVFSEEQYFEDIFMPKFVQTKFGFITEDVLDDVERHLWREEKEYKYRKIDRYVMALCAFTDLFPNVELGEQEISAIIACFGDQMASFEDRPKDFAVSDKELSAIAWKEVVDGGYNPELSAFFDMKKHLKENVLPHYKETSIGYVSLKLYDQLKTTVEQIEKNRD